MAQPGTSLLTLMGFRLEGIFPAALLPLLLTMVSARFIFLLVLTRFFFPCPLLFIFIVSIFGLKGNRNCEMALGPRVWMGGKS